MHMRSVTEMLISLYNAETRAWKLYENALTSGANPDELRTLEREALNASDEYAETRYNVQ